jgi:hypothetical protein
VIAEASQKGYSGGVLYLIRYRSSLSEAANPSALPD